MDAIETIAIVMIALATLKIALLPNIWMKFVKKIYSAPKILFAVELALSALVLYLLLQNGMSIVQIMAVITLGALLTGMGLAWYGKETVSWAEKILKRGVWKKSWLLILIWIALMIWTLVELLS